jgi:hypothetical protein
VGRRRRRRQEVTADGAEQMVSAMGLESSLWSSDTGAGRGKRFTGNISLWN